MLDGLVFSIVFISLTIVTLTTEIHVQDGCVEIVVGTAAGPTSDISCACVPDNDFWNPTRCDYKDYNTGWLSSFTTKVTIFDPPCSEKFEFPTRYAQVFYTADGCLRDFHHHPIHCCPLHPYRYSDLKVDVDDQTSPDDGTATLDTTPRLDEAVSFGDQPTSNEVSPSDENPLSLGDAMTGMAGLNLPAAKRGIFLKSPYRIRRKKSVVGR